LYQIFEFGGVDVDKEDVSFLKCQERRLFIFEMSTKEMIDLLSTKHKLGTGSHKNQQNRAEERKHQRFGSHSNVRGAAVT
jgi:hypothetical protein